MGTNEPVYMAELSRRSTTFGDDWAQVAAFTDLQIETLIDAILYATTDGDPAACTHARNVGEFAARTARSLGGLVDASFVRRVAVLSVSKPAVLGLIPELRAYADVVGFYQSGQFTSDNAHFIVVASIIGVADAFHRLLSDPDEALMPSAALRKLQDDESQPREIVDALAESFHSAPARAQGPAAARSKDARTERRRRPRSRATGT
jgi:hypothetical protein